MMRMVNRPLWKFKPEHLKDIQLLETLVKGEKVMAKEERLV